MSHTREDSAPLSLQPKLRKGHGSCRAVDKAVYWALLAPSIPNYRSASCRTWPMLTCLKKAPLLRSPFAITSNWTGPESTFLTTEQLKGKLPNQHPSLHTGINLNSLTDLCEHSKFHQNNLHALTGLSMLKNQASVHEPECPMGQTPSGLGSVAALEGAAAVNLTHPKNLDLALLWTQVFC